VSDDSPAKEPSDSPAKELTDDHIQRLLRNADRLSFGLRSPGFVLINRARLLEAHGITQKSARLIDQWVVNAGGDVQSLRRAAPDTQAVRKHRERTKRPDTIVWGIPADALKQDKAATA
jgi:hypothetical protein